MDNQNNLVNFWIHHLLQGLFIYCYCLDLDCSIQRPVCLKACFSWEEEEPGRRTLGYWRYVMKKILDSSPFMSVLLFISCQNWGNIIMMMHRTFLVNKIETEKPNTSLLLVSRFVIEIGSHCVWNKQCRPNWLWIHRNLSVSASSMLEGKAFIIISYELIS